MRFGKTVFVLLMAIVSTVFFAIGTARALDFADWPGTWFKVKVSETGKAGTVVLPGGKVVTNNEKTSENYLIIQFYDYTNTAFNVGYCTFDDGSVWKIQSSSNWPILGGEPKGFLTFFNFEYQQSQNVLQTYWIPLHVTGTENKQTVGEITSASFKNLGGIFLELIGTPVVTQRGIGTLTFTGSQIPRNKVLNDVPEGCRITAP